MTYSSIGWNWHFRSLAIGVSARFPLGGDLNVQDLIRNTSKKQTTTTTKRSFLIEKDFANINPGMILYRTSARKLCRD